MPEYKANFGAGLVNAKPMVRNSANTAWQECEKYVRNDANTAWIKVWPLYVAPVVAMPDVNDYKEAAFGTVTVGISLSSDGTFSTIGGQGLGPNSGAWCTAGAPADVEVYATVSGGTGASWSSSGLNAWVTAAGFYVSLAKTTNGTSSGAINLTFRNKTTQAQLDAATINLSLYRGIIE